MTGVGEGRTARVKQATRWLKLGKVIRECCELAQAGLSVQPGSCRRAPLRVGARILPTDRHFFLSPQTNWQLERQLWAAWIGGTCRDFFSNSFGSSFISIIIGRRSSRFDWTPSRGRWRARPVHPRPLPARTRCKVERPWPWTAGTRPGWRAAV
jgi:hypothetical protein